MVKARLKLAWVGDRLAGDTVEVEGDATGNPNQLSSERT
jgi:hypothetical protein